MHVDDSRGHSPLLIKAMLDNGENSVKLVQKDTTCDFGILGKQLVNFM